MNIFLPNLRSGKFDNDDDDTNNVNNNNNNNKYIYNNNFTVVQGNWRPSKLLNGTQGTVTLYSVLKVVCL